ncbi:hypothetical protein [Maridesulfovibrio sp. FT414]|uniref:prenylated flavin chaperone LpdD n=1 Tax=Maridesulfovibrio sp. FT414 TaxID=2979469 RepID=UPI003D805D43
MLTLTRKTERFTLEMTLIRMGRDLCVSLFGGDTPHIGAVALAVPHSGIKDRAKADATVSLLAVTGHREDGLAREMAYGLATHFNCTVSVSCGIHLDNARKDEISDILKASDALLKEALSSRF